MANKAKANGPKLVPLKEQAMTAIRDAEARIIAETRPNSLRRQYYTKILMRARQQHRAGAYGFAIDTATNAFSN